MLSRHFLRAKVLQSLYACQMVSSELYQVELSFKDSIAQFNTLGTIQLGLLARMRPVALRVLDDLSHKFLPSEAERNPSSRLSENVFLLALCDNLVLRRRMESLPSGSWPDEDVLRTFFLHFRSSGVYSAYVESPQTFESDQTFVLQLFRALVNDGAVRSAVCEQSLLWNDDFDQLAQYNFMMLKALDVSFAADSYLPLMYDERVEKDVEDYRFAFELLRSACVQHDENQELIRSHLRGWDFERVAVIDLILINMAIAEVTSFPTIPERVTIDEYIELSKEFSTERSKLFINGILDRIFSQLRAAGRINKTGRGLPVWPEEETDEAQGQEE
ncbi:MAG: N utilization substance protein B [bacterium P3]|nr:MAG: N utilization substance protein B [bacterium P3]KWW41911.1 MAG: N utilization substance protein B [bacterium F083]